MTRVSIGNRKRDTGRTSRIHTYVCACVCKEGGALLHLTPFKHQGTEAQSKPLYCVRKPPLCVRKPQLQGSPSAATISPTWAGV